MSVSMSRAAIAMVLLLIAQASAFADVRILASPGGEAIAYLQLFEKLSRSGERVVIDGPCFSACTLVLSAMPADRICATRRAVLGFHAPQLVTSAVANTPPRPRRAWSRRAIRPRSAAGSSNTAASPQSRSSSAAKRSRHWFSAAARVRSLTL